ncbi:Carboxypeptidase Y inhibitor [Wickerhamomyces ciferrii]|uniref:Carboxypeptidase Y inhibitor n=1 Tax=Wickerhamomyces ciferrii (strain ATCC 14091 / BCRC 22168 / CBS 111 / JCM 3599 / NBRC 0793 / NRRL Y-1031 F-60-10) TaxID=1206466 RepID=K0KQI7_WICCF|nr:Carboxypeptidase Y inhibitor [Wickerhamomyces ciferrii]CCH45301.1 Carboxypeptidase Y inhibitor [Wickerhamomyces ciferrii]
MPLLTISNSIIESLTKNEILSDVVQDQKFEPKGLLTISYGNSNEVALGNTLGIEDTQTTPKFQFTFNPTNKDSSSTLEEIKDTDLFTLILTDPDAPSRTDKKWSEYAHFIHTNLLLKSQSNASQDSDFFSTELNLDSQGKELLSYQGPAPPQGTGKHRYVFLLYKQPHGVEDLKAPKDRINWGYGEPATGVAKYAKENDLELYAVNFFHAENK